MTFRFTLLLQVLLRLLLLSKRTITINIFNMSVMDYRNLTTLCLLSVSTILVSCKRMDHDMKEVLVEYPAAYVVNGADASVSVINLASNEVSETLKLDSWRTIVKWPHHIYASPVTNELSIAVPGRDLSAGHGGSMVNIKGMVMVLDANKGIVTKDVQLPAMNHNAVFSPDGKEIWTSQMEMDGKILVYDAKTYKLKNTVRVGKDPAEVTFSADGSKAYVANGSSNDVSVINPLTKTIIATIPVGDEPVAAWIGYDNKMYVDNEDGETVSVIDVQTNTVMQTIALGFMPGSVAHHRGKDELWVTDPDNGKVHFWLKSPATGLWNRAGSFAAGLGAHAIAYSSDGAIAYVTNQEANSVSVIRVADHSKIKDIPVGKKPNGIVIKN